MVGSVIAHFTVIEKLGEGGMGVVYKAQDQHLPRFVALKLLPSRTPQGPSELARFFHEAQAVSMLQHPNIATIHMLLEHEGRQVIVFEYIGGGTLKEIVRQGHGLVPERVMDYALQIGGGLAEAHAKGVVHRDLKCENILATEKGQLKIIDFGLAKLGGMSAVTQAGMRMGTLACMSPEQVKGEVIDHRSDIYSLGVILYECLTGRMPFAAEYDAALMYEILHAEPPAIRALRPEVPAGLAQIVERAMEKDVRRRYQSIGEMLEDLEEAKKGNAPVEQRLSRWRRLSRPARKLWQPALVLAVVVALAYQLLKPTVQPAIRVAVLPFTFSGPVAEEKSYLSDGISEQVVNKLTKIKRVQMTPWVTSRRYRDTSVALDAIARQLDVKMFITGTIFLAGSRLRTSVSLIDLQNKTQVWADDYEGEQADIFTLQTEIALGAAQGMQLHLSKEEEKNVSAPPANSAAAFEYYIKGSEALQFGTREGTQEALAYFEKALQVDSNLAEAHVGKGTVNYNNYFYSWGGVEDLEAAEGDFAAALRLDPHSLNAMGGLILVYSERNKQHEALELARSVSEDADDVNTLYVKALSLTTGGLEYRAALLMDRILSIDPGYQAAAWYKVPILNWAGRPNEALQAGESYFERFGEDPEIHTWMGVAYHILGNRDAARLHYRRAISLFGESPNTYVVTMAALADQQLGDTAAAKRILQSEIERMEAGLMSHPTNYRLSSALAGLYAQIGNYSESDRLLDSSGPQTDDLPIVLKVMLGTGDRAKAEKRIAAMVTANSEDLFEFQVFNALGYYGTDAAGKPVSLEADTILLGLREIHRRNEAIY